MFDSMQTIYRTLYSWQQNNTTLTMNHRPDIAIKIDYYATLIARSWIRL